MSRAEREKYHKFGILRMVGNRRICDKYDPVEKKDPPKEEMTIPKAKEHLKSLMSDYLTTDFYVYKRQPEYRFVKVSRNDIEAIKLAIKELEAKK